MIGYFIVISIFRFCKNLTAD